MDHAQVSQAVAHSAEASVSPLLKAMIDAAHAAGAGLREDFERIGSLKIDRKIGPVLATRSETLTGAAPWQESEAVTARSGSTFCPASRPATIGRTVPRMLALYQQPLSRGNVKSSS